MAGQTFTLNFDAKFNVAQMKGAIGSIQSELNRLQLPQNLTKGITGTLTSLEKELRNFEVAAGKDLGQKNNFSAFERSAERISSLFKDLQIQARDLGQGISLDKFFPQDVVQTINDAKTALKNYESEVDKLNRKVSSQKGQVTKATAAQKVAEENLKAALKPSQGQLEKFATEYKQILTGLFNDIKIDPKNLFDQASLDQVISEAQKRIERLQQIQNNINAKGQTYKYADSTKEKAKAEEAALTELITKYNLLREAQSQQSDQVKKLQDAYDAATNKVKIAQTALQEFENTAKAGTADALNKLVTELNKLGIDTTGVTNIEQAKAALAEFSKTAEGEAATALEKLRSELERQRPTFDNTADAVRQSADAYRQFEDQLRDVSSVKSRIQYFFGLNNAINLVKRGIREAISTVKELDKAMTETAVVTSNTISDMWAKLPDYTKRANELGVSTLEAYQAATLYYQQGLNDDQAAALSVETLKMARIAGLEAADATDRMTNALRGFNMELNEVSAQKVDDVYSQLAAMSASNVDEISTAMTKVASLAHSANMEFETTAAFLAQIIETTRESAETAGTALKTVVARFSEVKKLYDMDELKGKDEEGQSIDVNKVSSALHTAGIDLNKYFLGEVGLDDIFMELASKWDSLTSVQQRYIATQAAGSRQQSRFIALMQDYARTQQLVGAAYNANGASAKQFEKTQESLQSKLARLKNAWDEFLMGLANNSIIKGVVDGLTTLLNIVNKLTGAFGTGAGFVLKWITAFSAFAGVKSLFKTGGFLDLAIMGGLQANGKGALANAAVRTGLLSGLMRNKGGIVGAAGILSGQAAETAAANATAMAGPRTPLIFGSGSLLSQVGKGLWGGAQKLGTRATFLPGLVGKATGGMASGLEGLGATHGLAAGLTGVATALGAVAVAVGVVVAGYQAWLRLTPEGHLKQAKQLAEVMNDVAASTQKNASEFKKATQDYQEYNNAVKSATSTAEYQKAVTDRTNYVSELIKNNPNFAQYVKASSENGQYTLTINQKDLEKASEEAANYASKAAADASFSSALVAGKQADVYQAQLRRAGVNLERGTIYDAETQAFRELTGEELAKYSTIQRQIEASRAEETSYAQQAFSKQLEKSGLSDDITNLLSNALAKGFNEDEYLSKVNDRRAENWWDGQATRSALEAQYYSLYGQQADASMKRGELARAVAQAQVNQKQQDTTNQVAKLIKNGNYDDILKAIAGEIDFSQTQLELEETTKKLQKFSDITGISVEDYRKQIQQSQKVRQEIKKSNQSNIFEQALKSGHNINQTFFETIKGLDFDKLNIVSDIINQAAGKVGEQAFQSLFDTLPEMSNESLQEIQSFFNNFNLDNPITALEQLNNKIEEVGADSSFGKLLGDIKETNKALFESSNLVQSFLLSESYEQLSDTIEEATKSNKKLNGKNIEDMAESCHELDALLQEINEDLGENTDSAQALAEAINLIGEGSLAIDQITDSLLAALGAGESFESLIGNVQQWIEDFNKGTDLTEGTQHITSVLEEAGKYVESWQFGNEPLQNIYDHIFGEGKYATYMDKAYEQGLPFDQIETKLAGDIKHLSSLAENEGLGALQELNGKLTGLTSINGSDTEFKWDLSQYKNQENPIQAAIQDVATQLGVTEETARAFIESWASHMYDLRQEWNDLNFTDAMTAFSDELGKSAVITEAELDALSAKTGKTKTEILAALEEIRSKGNVPIVVSWQDEKGANLTGQDLIDKFNEAAEQTGDIQSTTKYNGRYLETKYDYSKIGEEFSKTFDNVVGPNGILQNGINAIDFSALTKHLVDAYKLSPQQANEVANNIIQSTDGKFAQTIKVPIEAEDGSIEMMEKTIIADSAEGLSAAVNAELEAADMTILAGKLADLDVESVGSRLVDALITAGSSGAASIQSDLNGIKVDTIKVPVDWYWVNSPPSGGGGGDATGGIVESYAKGSENFHVGAGTALTGEEGPELVWNKNDGYAYVTGQDGPEFADLRPGDRIFNASETKRIFKNSEAKGGLVDSFASGGWKPAASTSKSGGGGSRGGGGSGGSEKEKTPEEWKNELDWLYNLMEDIAELERDQKAIEEQYEDYLADQTKTGGDLYRLLVQQLGNLYTQLNHQTFTLEKREQEMREFMDTTNDKDQYLWYNWQDRTLEIDWDAIDRITDEEEYKHVKELVDEAEEIQDKIDDADDAIMDITNQIQELENIWRDTFTDFEDRVLDAIVKSYQQVIDKYSELNDTLNNSNTQILDSLQKQISLERQIRDNTKTEEEISDEEARLAYLRRDTSGGNDLAALQLERELADQRENYEDTLVDQAINRLQEDNDAAAQQRERQIEIMQAQLDYQSENGEFNAYVRELLTSAMGADGELLTNSDLVALLKEQENWDAMSDVSKQVWDEELNGTFKEVAAFLLKENAEQNGTFYTALTEAVKTVSTAIGSYSQAMTKLGNQIASAGSSGGGGYSGGSGSSDGGYSYSSATSSFKSGGSTVEAVQAGRNAAIASSIAYNQAWNPKAQVATQAVNSINTLIKSKKYATGGLASTTGFAWLDGTSSEPEYVLNARQTDAFLKLADVLPSMMNGTSATTSNTFGATYVNLSVNLKSVSPDYDVDRMVDLVKDKLYDSSMYRNNNVLSFLR